MYIKIIIHNIVCDSDITLKLKAYVCMLKSGFSVKGFQMYFNG